jgi:hypothetical protein
MIEILRVLKEKGDTMQEPVDDISREMEIL